MRSPLARDSEELTCDCSWDADMQPPAFVQASVDHEADKGDAEDELNEPGEQACRAGAGRD